MRDTAGERIPSTRFTRRTRSPRTPTARAVVQPLEGRVLMAAATADGASPLAGSAVNLLVNGSFEEPDIAPASYTIFRAGSSIGTGWKVLAGNGVSDLVANGYSDRGTSWPAASDGDQVLYVGDASREMTVGQEVALAAGSRYRLTFDLGGLAPATIHTGARVRVDVLGPDGVSLLAAPATFDRPAAEGFAGQSLELATTAAGNHWLLVTQAEGFPSNVDDFKLVALDPVPEPAPLAPTHAVGDIPGTVLAGGNPVRFAVRPPDGAAGPVSVTMASRGYEPPVVTTDGAGVQTHVYALPVVGSSLSFTFDPATGAFAYAPDADDRFDFDLTFGVPGQDGLGLPMAQRVTVVPRDLPAEGDLVSSATDNLPNAESLDYVTVNVTNGPTRRFNAVGGVPTRAVEITGKTIVLAPDHASRLYERFAFDPARGAHSKDVQKLTIYAERVVIGSHVRLPQTDVTIHARELVFRDLGGTASRIETTPLDNVIPRANQGVPVATSGEDAGNVTLHVGAMRAPGNPLATRFVLGGGNGQGGAEGRDGTVAGQSLRVLVSHALIAVAQYRASKWVYEPSGFGSWRWRLITYNPVHVDFGPALPDGTPTSQAFPGDGQSATPGGRPGDGGRGGTLTANAGLRFPVEAVVQVPGGSAGPRAANRTGAPGGEPRDAYHYLFYGDPNRPGVDVLNRTWKHRRSKNGTGWTAPGGSNGSAGAVARAAEPASPAWLLPAVFRPMLAYVKDAYLAGNLEFARQASVELQGLLQQAPSPAAGQADPYQPLRAELEILRGRAEAGLDYFGNPGGWTPMLSLGSTLAAYQGEIDSAIRIKYLARLVDRAAANSQSAVDLLSATLDELDTEILRYRDQLDAHQQLLPRLQQQIAEIDAKGQLYQLKLRAKEQELAARAERNIRGPFWKRAVGILGSVLKVFPLGQPALGVVGAGLQTVATLSSEPLEAIGQIAGLGGAFKELAPGLKAARDELAQVGVNIKAPSKATKEELNSYFGRMTAEGKRWGDSLKKLNAEIQPFTAPRDKVEAELAKLKAEDAEFHALVDELTEINGLKEVFARDLANALKTIGDSVTSITQDQQTALAANRRLTEAAGRLDHETIGFVRDLARRADERLLRWQYYMAKAYEYETLKPYAGRFNLEALAQRITSVVEGGSGIGWLDAPTGSGAALGIDVLRTVYETELKSIANQLMDEFATKANGRRFRTENRPFRLSAAEVRRLNETGEVTLNLVDRGLVDVNGTQDAIRLVHMRAEQVSATAADPANLPELTIEFFHSGVSRQRAGGRVFQFRHHRSGDIDTLVGENPIRLGATRFYIGSGDPAQHDTADSAQLALLSYLVGSRIPSNVAGNEEIFFVQPAAWADVTIRKSGAGVTLDDALFRFDYSYTIAPSDKATLEVRPLDPALLPIVSVSAAALGLETTAALPGGAWIAAAGTSSADLSGRTDGRGSFSRTFDKFATLRLTAEPTYGGLGFEKWVDEQGRLLSSSPHLAVTLDRNRVVRPIYARATPIVTAVFARGTAWRPDFKSYLAGQSSGHHDFGFRADNLAPGATLPWINLNEVVVRYSGPPAGGGIPQPGSVLLDGLVSDYAVTGVTQIDPQTFALTLDRPLGVVPAAQGGGQNGDRVTLTLPGGGPGGGAYSLTLNVLQGDANRGGNVVNSFGDLAFVRARLNRSAASPGTSGATYTPWADVNGSGDINSFGDLAAVRARLNDALPAAPAAAPAAQAVFASGTPIGTSSRRRSWLEDSAELIGG